MHCTQCTVGCIVEDAADDAAAAAENIAQISAITMGSGPFISSSALELATTPAITTAMAKAGKKARKFKASNAPFISSDLAILRS
jgi:hypothetical protein